MKRYKQLSILFTTLLCISLQPAFSQLKNFSKKGEQILRFSTAGDAIDAHDGEIAYFDGVYYLYGTSYDCGFEWGNKGAPFCGFKVYTSKDMQTWEDKGFLFDASTPVWQSRCNGSTYGCFRPHVIYNSSTKKYILWINVYDNVTGYRVFTSTSPAGPFVEQAEPKLAVNSNMPAAGLNNGDHDLFIDDDGIAYLAYTDWRANGAIVIEKLSDDYLTGTGVHVKSVTPNRTEAPCLFKRNDIYYVIYSDPNCGYCSGTGSSYRTARHPLGPWSEGKKISDNSCGGQPSFVSTIKLNDQTIYLYGSDLWNNAAKNEALANYYWAPLTFAEDGSINKLNCAEDYRLPKAGKEFRLKADITQQTQRSQTFSVQRSGTLSKLEINVYRLQDPDEDLSITIYKADERGLPAGTPLYETSVASSSIGFSARQISIAPGLKVNKRTRYVFVLKTAATKGFYGIAFSEITAPQQVAAISKDGGLQFSPEPAMALKFSVTVSR